MRFVDLRKIEASFDRFVRQIGPTGQATIRQLRFTLMRLQTVLEAVRVRKTQDRVDRLLEAWTHAGEEVARRGRSRHRIRIETPSGGIWHITVEHDAEHIEKEDD